MGTWISDRELDTFEIGVNQQEGLSVQSPWIDRRSPGQS